ncbi:MAG: hypothetical protein [Microvirus sp.]|nr:MAG: hypothetical protein [Microvirus sp.]
MKRHQISRKKSRKMFKRGINRVHKKNTIMGMRGGIRL